MESLFVLGAQKLDGGSGGGRRGFEVRWVGLLWLEEVCVGAGF